MPPLVPGFTIAGELSSCATGSTWAAVRNLDDHRFVLRIVPVADVTEAHAQAAQLMAVLDRIENQHVVRLHSAIALADGDLALVLDQVTGGSLADVLRARGQLTAGETVTTVAPLFGALADLHAAEVAHGDLAPANVLFNAAGRPLLSDLGLVRLLGRHAVAVDGDRGFVAPELLAGAEPSPASDVYAMAALGWFCLTGDPPAPAAQRHRLTTLRPGVPARLVEVLTSCLSTDPAGRPSARAAAVEVFDAAPAEAVRLLSVSDPAAEITRRIRAAAVSAPALTTSSNRKRHRDLLVISMVALLVVVALGTGATWFLRRPTAPAQPVAIRSVAQPAPSSSAPSSPAPSSLTAPSPTTQPTATAPKPTVAPTTSPGNVTDVVMALDSPRVAAAGLLQALVDARALAYVARKSDLLDLVYAPGAARAGVDQANIAAALTNGGTYLGLAFVVKDVAFLDGTSDTARIRATIVTPAYETGQPDGRKVPHRQESVGPSVFSLRLTPDGWRILGLTTP